MPGINQPLFNPSQMSFEIKTDLMHLFLVVIMPLNFFQMPDKCSLFRFMYSRIIGKAGDQISMYNFDSWKGVDTKLLERYQDEKHCRQLIQEFTNCKQGSDESVTGRY